jgi:MFS family permease
MTQRSLEILKRTNKWIVLWSATGVSVILGILYVWSVISKSLMSELGWTSTQASLPYTIFTIMMAVGFFSAGRIQDRIGPRKCVVACAVLMGLGLMISGLFTSPWLVALGFGVICGAGVGAGNVSSLAPALKWFPSTQRGMVSGAVLAGIGFSAVIYAPVTDFLLQAIGVSKSFLIYGAVSFVLMYLLSFNMVDPPEGYDRETGLFKPEPSDKKDAGIETASPQNAARQSDGDMSTKEMLKSPNFYKQFVVFALSSASGLMIIGHAAKIAQVQVGWEGGFLLVIILNMLNTAGRFLGGSISDKLGRLNTLKLILAVQTVNMLLFGFYGSIPIIIVGIMVQGFCYGTIFSVMPSLTADLYGMRNFGANYGSLFLAWGVGGIIGPMTAARVLDTTGEYSIAYMIACALTVVALAIVFAMKIKKKKVP